MRAKRYLHIRKHDNHRWMVSYADFITLMFAFFTALYAISNVHNEKYKVFSESVNRAFHFNERTLEPIQVGQIALRDDLTRGDSIGMDGGESMRDGASDLLESISDIESHLEGLTEDSAMHIEKGANWISISLENDVLFSSGDDRLTDTAKEKLALISEKLQRFPNAIRVEGYTDNVPIVTDTYPSNWELSSARAAVVLRSLVDQGVDPRRLSAVGFGEQFPIASNASADGRAKNRRVVLFIAREPDRRRPEIIEDIREAQIAKSQPEQEKRSEVTQLRTEGGVKFTSSLRQTLEENKAATIEPFPPKN